MCSLIFKQNLTFCNFSTLVFTRPCGSHSDALLVSRALLLPSFSQIIELLYSSWVLFSLLTDFGQVSFYFVIFQNILRDGLTFLLTFQFNIHLLCFIGFFSSQKNSSISVQFLQKFLAHWLKFGSFFSDKLAFQIILYKIRCIKILCVPSSKCEKFYHC